MPWIQARSEDSLSSRSGGVAVKGQGLSDDGDLDGAATVNSIVRPDRIVASKIAT